MLNTNKKYVRQPFMLGEEPGIYDSINMDQEVFDLYKRAIAQMWTEDEFNYAPCKAEFAEDNDGKDLMVDTLKYQWRADSLACNLYTLLQPFISNDQITQLILFNTFMECLTPDHEVYVKGRGWKWIKDVAMGDEVIQYNPEKDILEFAEVLGTVRKPYKDDLIVFEDSKRHINQCVTKNHRMPVKPLYRDEGPVYPVLAKDVHYSARKAFPVSARLVGAKTSLTALDKFRIAFQADGSYRSEAYNGKRSGYVTVVFSFKKVRKINEFENLLDEIGYERSEIKNNHPSKAGYKTFSVKVPLADFDRGWKSFDWVPIEEISYEWCREFIDYSKHWDGCDRYVQESDKKTLVTYTTKSRRCAEDYSLIAHLAGYRASWYDTANGCIQISVTNISYVTGHCVSKRTQPYDGMVYCITVPSGAFLVRRGKAVQITFNCIHSGSYSEIVKNAFPDPIKTIEDLSADEISSDRLETVSKAFCDLRQVGLDYTLGKVTREEVYADVYKGVVALYLLERIQFICSFAVTFSLGELGRFQPVAMAVRKICADETVIHAETDLLILKDMQKDPLWESTNTPEFQETLTKMVDEVIGRECAWVDQVFEGRKLPGLTPELLKEWAMFNAQIVKDNLGLKHDGKHKVNPLPFLKGWISSNTTQVANQEQNDGVQYLIGGISNDTDDVDIDLDF